MAGFGDTFLSGHPANISIVLRFVVKSSNEGGKSLYSLMPIFHGEAVFGVDFENLPALRFGVFLDLSALLVENLEFALYFGRNWVGVSVFIKEAQSFKDAVAFALVTNNLSVLNDRLNMCHH